MSVLKLNILDGSVVIKGKYDTKKAAPFVDVIIDVKDIDLQNSYNTFDIIKTYVPIAAKCEGKVSMMVGFNAMLDNTMTPIYKSLNGTGFIKSSSVSIKGVNTLDKIAQATKLEKFKNVQLQNLNISFKLEQGRLNVEPFDIKIDQMSAKIEGYASVDQRINFIMDLTVPTKSMNAQASSFTNGLIMQSNSRSGGKMTLGEKVNFVLLVAGTTSAPEITTNLKTQMNDALEEMKNKANMEMLKKRADAENNAKASAEKAKADADKMKNDASNKAKLEAERLKKQADDAKKKAEEDAKNKAKGALNKLIK